MSNRDYVMARLGVALASNIAQNEMLSTALAIFTEPDDDTKGDERRDQIEAALHMCHEMAAALMLANERFDAMSKDELSESEESGGEDPGEGSEGGEDGVAEEE